MPLKSIQTNLLKNLLLDVWKQFNTDRLIPNSYETISDFENLENINVLKSKGHELLRICDKIHSGQKMIRFNYNDLPSDDFYELMKHFFQYESEKEFSDKIFPMGSINKITLNIDLENDNLKQNELIKEKKVIQRQFDQLTNINHDYNFELLNIEVQRIFNKPEKTIIITPKYDGISIGLELIKNEYNNSFRVNRAMTRQGNDCSFEIQQLFYDELIDSVRENQIIFPNFEVNYKLSNNNQTKYLINNAKSIEVRCELILNTREFNNNFCSKVSGFLKKGYSEIRKRNREIRLIAYELVKVVFDEDLIYTPTQLEANFILHNTIINLNNGLINFGTPYICVNELFLKKPSLFNCNLTKYIDYIQYIDNKELVECEYFKTLDTQFVKIKSLFDKLKIPLDGLVLCSTKWCYSNSMDLISKTSYNKIAWKPSTYFYSYITGVEISHSVNGKLSFVIYFKPLEIDGRNYQKSKIQHYQFNGIYKFGDIIRMRLSNGIMMEVLENIGNHKELITESLISFEDKDIIEELNSHINDKSKIICLRGSYGELIQIPNICPYCQTPLNFGERDIYCESKNSVTHFANLYSKLISGVFKLKPGVLQIYNKTHTEFIKSNLTITRIEELIKSMPNSSHVERITYEIPNFFEVFNSIDLETQAVLLNIAGKKNVKKLDLQTEIKNSWLYKK